MYTVSYYTIRTGAVRVQEIIKIQRTATQRAAELAQAPRTVHHESVS